MVASQRRVACCVIVVDSGIFALSAAAVSRRRTACFVTARRRMRSIAMSTCASLYPDTANHPVVHSLYRPHHVSCELARLEQALAARFG